MANIRKYQARDFGGAVQRVVQLPESGAADVFDRIAQIGHGLADAEAARAGQLEGIQSQQGQPELVQRDGFLGVKTIRSEAFNEGARLAFAAQKETELRRGIEDLSTRFQNDPDGYQKASDKFYKQFMTGVPTDKVPQFQTMFSRENDQALFAQQEGQRRVQRDQQKLTLIRTTNDLLASITTTAEAHGATEAVEDDLLHFSGQIEQALRNELISPVEAERLIQNGRLAMRKADAIFAYNVSDDKAALVKVMDDPDGPLGDLSTDQRATIVSELSQRYRTDVAQVKGRYQTLKAGADEIISLYLDGRTNVDATQIKAGLDQMRDDPEVGPLAARLSGLIDQAQQLVVRVKSFKTLPVEQQVVALAQLDQQIDAAPTTEGQAQYEALLAAHGEAKKELADDALSYAADAGVIELGGFSLADPSTWDARWNAKNAAEANYGQRVELLTKEEAANLIANYNATDVNGKVALIGMLNRFGRDADHRAGLYRMLSDSNPEIAIVAGLGSTPDLTRGQALRTQRMILQGQEVLAANPGLIKNEAALKREAFIQVDKMFPALTEYSTDESGRTRKALAEALIGIHVSLGDVESTDLDPAMTLLFGTDNPPEFGGVPTIPPVYGMDGNRFEDFVQQTPDEDLRRAGGGGDPVHLLGSTSERVSWERIKQDGVLIHVGPMQYMIEMPEVGGGRLVLSDPRTHEPYRIDFSHLYGDLINTPWVPQGDPDRNESPFRRGANRAIRNAERLATGGVRERPSSITGTP